MKDNTHPEYFDDAEVVCGGCGHSFTVGSTMQKVHISICSKCHPYYTGSQGIVDTAGRVDKFKAKYAKFISE